MILSTGTWCAIFILTTFINIIIFISKIKWKKFCELNTPTIIEDSNLKSMNNEIPFFPSLDTPKKIKKASNIPQKYKKAKKES